jgi:hypothetical protein
LDIKERVEAPLADKHKTTPIVISNIRTYNICYYLLRNLNLSKNSYVSCVIIGLLIF